MEEKKYSIQNIKFEGINIPSMLESFRYRIPYVDYGADNLYPQYLTSLYNQCAIHKAVIDSKREQTCGEGLLSPDRPEAVIMPVNGSETVDDVFRKCALDFMLFGGFALNIVWSRDRKSIAEIYHLDFSKIRAEKIVDGNDRVENYYFSNDWSNTRKYKPVMYPAFDQNNNEPSQILYHFDYSPNLSYYPETSYSGAIPGINIDIEIKKFHLSNLRNGLNPSLFINFNNGVPDDDTQYAIKRGLENQFGGSENAGRAVIAFNESKEQAPEITPIQSNGSDDYYKAIYEDVIRSIMAGHRVSSGELFAVSTAGKLGNQNEIIEHSEYFRNMVIVPYQQEMLAVFDKVMSLKFESKINLKVKPLTILNLDNQTANNVE